MSNLSDLYHELILDHNKHPRNRRSLEDHNCKAEGYNPLCGDRVTVYLKLKDDVIQEATFEGSGCAISTASASLMTEGLTGKTIDEAQALFDKFHAVVSGDAASGNGTADLGKLQALAGVRRYPARVKCATLVWHTLKAALGQSDQVVSTE